EKREGLFLVRWHPARDLLEQRRKLKGLLFVFPAQLRFVLSDPNAVERRADVGERRLVHGAMKRSSTSSTRRRGPSREPLREASTADFKMELPSRLARRLAPKKWIRAAAPSPPRGSRLPAFSGMLARLC